MIALVQKATKYLMAASTKMSKIKPVLDYLETIKSLQKEYHEE